VPEPIDELEEFNRIDKFMSFSDVKPFIANESHSMYFLEDENSLIIFNGPVVRMEYCLQVCQDMTFKLFVRGEQVATNLRIAILSRKSQLVELIRELQFKYESLDEKAKKFNDRQNQLLVKKQKGKTV